MILKNNSVFSFSSTLICVKINLNINNFGSTISLKIIHGTNQNNEYSFNSNDKVLIRLGRLKTNLIDIDFNDESTSRLQTSILYENNNWYIVDGDGVKKSLNGTWFFADEYITINEGMIFRAGSTTFKSHLFTPFFVYLIFFIFYCYPMFIPNIFYNKKSIVFVFMFFNFSFCFFSRFSIA